MHSLKATMGRVVAASDTTSSNTQRAAEDAVDDGLISATQSQVAPHGDGVQVSTQDEPAVDNTFGQVVATIGVAAHQLCLRCKLDTCAGAKSCVFDSNVFVAKR